MLLKDKENFVPLILKMLAALGYEKIEEHTGKAYNITATKDGKKYCFKCQYDIDAVGENKMKELVEANKNHEFDEAVFITNSSFISSAKKIGDKEGIKLWDRNTVDRMCISVMDVITEDRKETPQAKISLFTGVIIAAVLAILAIAYFLFLK